MATAFDDLIPQQPGAANDPFGDLVPAAKVPNAAVAQPGAYGDPNSVAVFADEAAPKTIPDDVLKAYNVFSRTAKTAEDLVAYGEQHGFQVPLKESRQFIAARDKAGGAVAEGVGWVKPDPAPVVLPPEVAAEQADIAHSDGMFDRLGDLWSRGGAGVEAGAYSLGAALHDINHVRLPWQDDDTYYSNLGGSKLTQLDLRQKAAMDRALAGTPIENEQRFENIDGIGSLGQFVYEQGVQSLPGMATAVASLPAYIAANTGTIAQQRAANDGREDASLGDVGVAAPAGIASGILERAGIESILNPHAGNFALRVGKAALGEGSTEVGQTGVEYLGGNLGTDAGINAEDMLKQMEAAGVAGVGMGGAIHPVVAGVKAAPGAASAAVDAAQGLPALMSAMSMEAQPAPALSAPLEPVPEPMIAPRQVDAFADLVPEPRPGATEPSPAPESKPVAAQPAIVAAPAEGGEAGNAVAAGDAPAPIQTAQAREPQPLQGGSEKYVRTPAGNKVRTRMEVVEASTLNKATGELQNRDRSRDTTTLQVQDIIGKFDPELLGDDPSSDRGAPIVGQDHTVLSGNGRMLALNQIYDQHPRHAYAYRTFINDQGFSTEGMDRPVLIRRVAQDMTPEEARQFVIESNKDNKLELSPVERARSDADAVTPDMLAKYAGGDLNSGANAPFVASFAKSLTAGELGNVIGSDRRLTTAGIERIENAVVAKAYDHPKLLEKLMESAHNEIRAITSSLANVAPAWASMRAASKAGEIEGRYDITDDLADAAMRVAEARRAGTKPADILTQSDAFNPMSPITERLVEAFYAPGMKRAGSVKSVTDFLSNYVKAATSQKATEGLFGAEPGKAPADILTELLRQRDGGETLFDAPTKKENDDGPLLDARGAVPGSDAAPGSGRTTGDAEPSRPAAPTGAHARSAGAGASGDFRGVDHGSLGRAEGLPRGQSSGATGIQRSAERVAEPEAGSRPHGPGVARSAAKVADGEAEAHDVPSAATGSLASRDAEAPAGRRDGNGRRANPKPGRSDQLLDALDSDEPPYAPQGGYKPSFEQASFTDRASIYGAAAEAVGLDTDRFRLLPAPRQIALLQRALGQRFGIKVAVDQGMQERFAIDQMLDAFQNAQGMAHVLSLPARAVSLDGKLSLKLVKNAGFLGSYSPGSGEITLPKRSNSFAHEWGHALDYHLLSLTDGDGRGLSGSTRADGVADKGALPANVRTAFVDLLNAMFFDKAGAAERIMQLEKKIAAAKDGTKGKSLLQAQLQRMKDGSSKARGIETAFHKKAKSFDGPGGEYWSSPTEMFARAFEAYVSNTVEARGLSTEFIGKGDANYLDGAGERFAKTFPKGEERADIFAAFDTLFDAIAEHELAAPGAAAERPSGPVSKITDLDKLPKVERQRGIISREVTEIRNHLTQLAKEKAGRGKDPKSAGEWLADANGAVLMSMTGAMRMIQRRSNSPSLQKVIDLLTKQDGKGDRTVARTFHEDVLIRSQRGRNRLSNTLKANGLLKGRTAEDDRMLRDLLIGAREDGPANFVKAAAAIRQLLDNEWYENQKAGIDLGYARNGYLQRVLDMPRVWNDPQGFVRDAAKVYELVFDKAFHDADTVAASEELLPRFLKLARSLAAKGHDIDAEPVRKILKAIAKAEAGIEKLTGKGEDTGKLETRLEELNAELSDALGELWDQVRPAFAKERAEAWLSRINLVAGEEHNAAAPDSKYTKHRELPPEADKLMEQFYLQDPVESVVNYLNQSARRTAYAQRFGPDGAKRTALFEAMAAEGVSPADQRSVEGMLDIATGRRRSEMNSGFQKFLGWVNALGTMALLPRAWISSLAEPFTSAIVKGDAQAGFKMIGMQLGQALGAPSSKWRHEVSRAMGIVADIGSDGIMEARYGQTFGDATRADRAVSTMFRRTLLTPLTRSQKIAGVGLGHAFLDQLAGTVATGEGGARDGAIALLRELGVRDPEAFSAQLLQIGRPSVEALDSEFGDDYSTAQLRFSDMVIQNPSAMDRPELSQNPAGRILYSITGFSYGYWRNVIKRTDQLLRQKRDIEGMGAMTGHLAQVVAGAALAYLIGTTVSTLREYLLNRRRWRELEDKGELESTMAQLGFTRVFSFGAADPAIQAYSGLKYQRDLGTALLGAKVGFFADSMSKPLMLSVKNSRKTNTAEYNAAKGVTQMVAPVAALGLSQLPGGAAVDIVTGAGISYITSPAFADDVATAAVGPKNGSRGSDGKKVKSGPSGYDKALNAAFGEVKAKKPSDE